MTGFGLGVADSDQLRLQCEIHSVNHRNLSLEINLPVSLLALEPRIIQRLERRFTRGRVTVTVRSQQESRKTDRFIINEELARSAIDLWRRIAREEDIHQEPDLASVFQLPGILERVQEPIDLEPAWSLLSKALDNAMEECILMRSQEGERLCVEIARIADQIGVLVSEIEKTSEGRVATAKQKVQERLKEMLDPLPVDPALVMNEAALLINKADIREELDRLRSHLAALADFESEENGSPGRKLDFIAQEILREGNTIASKANLWGVSNQAVRLRTLSEAIRQQAANLE